MIVVLALIAALFFVLFCIAASSWNIERVRNAERTAAWETEKAAINKIGKWYQDRVEELENETRQLAEQIVAAGAIRQHAMPLPPADPGYEYATDPTGIIVERLDPRDAL